MMLFQLRTWRLAAKNLYLHPMRSMLTVLGIFIGVASVVWLLAISEGISQEAQRQIEELGATNIILRSRLPMEETSGETSLFVKYGILRKDVDALEEIETIVNSIKIREAKRETHYGGVDIDARLVGCTAEYADALQLDLDVGHFISDVHVKEKAAVCVLSASAARRFFPVDDPLGKTIRIRELPFNVIGVMKHRRPMAGIGSSLSSQDFEDDVYIPITSFWQKIGDKVLFLAAGHRQGQIIELSQITFQVGSTNEVMFTADAIRRTMEVNHELEDYVVVVPLELLEQARTTRLMFMVFMGMIAAVTLIVGGIGIMNIMLATVTERTREIGIRRALGARRIDITGQFLAETVVLSTVGGGTGILGGLTCPWVFELTRGILDNAIPEAMANLPTAVQNLTPVIVTWSIPLAFGISVAIGVTFGIYPAMRAAQMDPIQALRHE